MHLLILGFISTVNMFRNTSNINYIINSGVVTDEDAS